VLLIAGAVVWFAIPQERTATLEWGGGEFTAKTVGVDLQVAEAPYSTMAAEAMFDLVPTDYLALRPLEVSAEDKLPESGVTLSLTLPSPLPPEAAVTFAYLDEELGVWLPEATSVSEDRQTITAVVHHLSQWDVFVSAVEGAAEAIGGFVADVADEAVTVWERGSAQLMRFTHELLGNAADMPECGPRPIWVSELLSSDNAEIDYGLGDDAKGNAAVLLCMGTDPENPGQLQVKAAANRSYGFPVVLVDGVVPVAAGSSSIDSNLSSVLEAGAAMFFDGASNWSLSPSQFVFATQEYTATFSEANLREAGVGRIMSFQLPDLVQVVVSSTLKLALEEVGEGSDMVSGILTTLSMVQDCDFTDLSDTTDAALIVWLNTCASALDADTVAGAMNALADDVFQYNYPDTAKNLKSNAKLVKKVLGKLKMLMIFSVAQSVIDYIGDWQTEEAVNVYPAWYAQVLLAPEPPLLESLFGQYEECGNRLDAQGIWQSATKNDCGWGDDFRHQQSVQSTTWNGDCYVIKLKTSTAEFVEDPPRPIETWYACPAGFGGPGNDSRDRIGQEWRSGEVGSWDYRL